MTITDTTVAAQTEAISFEFDLPHEPKKVWRALTDPSLLAEWLLPVTGFEPRAGSAFVFKTQPYPGWDGTVNCRVIEIDEPRKLSYAWVVGNLEIDTTVTFTLAATPTGTRLSLVQTGFKPEQKQNSGGARYGWKMMGEKLVGVLAKLA